MVSKDNSKSFDDAAANARDFLEMSTNDTLEEKNQYKSKGYYKRFSKNQLTKFPRLTEHKVNKAISELLESGYEFDHHAGAVKNRVALRLSDIIDIYHQLGEEKYRAKHDRAWVISVQNLKGGVSKTVGSVSIAHALRTHPDLIKQDLRILVIDLDPQSSTTMFLSPEFAIGEQDNTSAQAMLQKPSREVLLRDFVKSSSIEGVDVMPSSIDDAFIASKWDELCDEHLPDQHSSRILVENIIEPIAEDYDFIFIDNGPHLDAFLYNTLAAANMLLTPLPPSQVDFHSTCKYIMRLPELLDELWTDDIRDKSLVNFGFMAKIQKKDDHRQMKSIAKNIFGSDMLDTDLPRLDAFEKCGETLDTVISVDPALYQGSKESLNNAKNAAFELALSVFHEIEVLRK